VVLVVVVELALAVAHQYGFSIPIGTLGNMVTVAEEMRLEIHLVRLKLVFLHFQHQLAIRAQYMLPININNLILQRR
jgi:energy-converting hydrogenase Eha subunit E